MPLMTISTLQKSPEALSFSSYRAPHSASQERVTPIREFLEVLVLLPQEAHSTPVALQQGLGTQHSNYSRGNLSLHSNHDQRLSEEYTLNEHGRKVPMHDSPERELEDSYVEEEHHGGHSHALQRPRWCWRGCWMAAMHHHHAHVEDDEHDDPELLEDTHGYYHQEVHLLFDMFLMRRKGAIKSIQSVSG